MSDDDPEGDRRMYNIVYGCVVGDIVVEREILVTGGLSRNAATSVSSRSLKATLLSWCAEADYQMSVRRLSGGHMSRTDKSAAI